MYRQLAVLSLCFWGFMLLRGQTLEDMPSKSARDKQLPLEKWCPFVHEGLGFSVLMPKDVPPEFVVRPGYEDPGSFGTTRYSYEYGGIDFSVICDVLPPHLHYQDASSVYIDNIILLNERRMNKLEDAHDITLQGIKGKHLFFKPSLGGVMESVVFFRANRLYLFSATSSSEHHDSVAQNQLKKVLDSFSLLPLQHTPLGEELYGKGFYARFPAPPVREHYYGGHAWSYLGADSVNVWEARDPATGFAYMVSQAYFPDWAQIQDWEEVFKTVPKDLIEQPPFYTKVSTTLQAQRAYDAYSYREQGTVQQYIRTLVQGQSIFQLYCDLDSLQPEHAQAFMAAFHATPTSAFDWAGSKVPALLSALSSPDPTTAARARSAHRFHPFTPQDFNLILNNLRQRALAHDTSATTAYILETLASANYPSFIDSLAQFLPLFNYSPDLQAQCFIHVIHSDTFGQTGKILRLFNQFRPHPQRAVYQKGLSHALSYGFDFDSDSLHLYPHCTFYWEDPYFVLDFLNLNVELSFQYDPPRRPSLNFHTPLKALAQDWIDHPRYQDAQPPLLSKDYELLIETLIAALPADSAWGYVSQLMALGGPQLEEFAVLHALQAELPVSKAQLIHLLQQRGYQFELLKWLWDNDQQKRVPKEYFEQANVARASMESTVRLENGIVPTTVELLKKHSYLWNGTEEKILYVYRIQTPDSPDWQIAFAGPFPESGDAFSSEFHLSGTRRELWSAEREAKQIRKWLDPSPEE